MTNQECEFAGVIHMTIAAATQWQLFRNSEEKAPSSTPTVDATRYIITQAFYKALDNLKLYAELVGIEYSDDQDTSTPILPDDLRSE